MSMCAVRNVVKVYTVVEPYKSPTTESIQISLIAVEKDCAASSRISRTYGRAVCESIVMIPSAKAV